MSLNWEWTDKMGEVIYEDDRYDPEHPYKTNIYQGNALMIWCSEWATDPRKPMTPDNTSYSLGDFCANINHLRNMLGLNASSVPKIVAELAKAHTNIAIELYYEE